MAKSKISQDTTNAAPLPTSLLTPTERITFLANIIVERIAADQAHGRALLKLLGAK